MKRLRSQYADSTAHARARANMCSSPAERHYALVAYRSCGSTCHWRACFGRASSSHSRTLKLSRARRQRPACARAKRCRHASLGMRCRVPSQCDDLLYSFRFFFLRNISFNPFINRVSASARSNQLRFLRLYRRKRNLLCGVWGIRLKKMLQHMKATNSINCPPTLIIHGSCAAGCQGRSSTRRKAVRRKAIPNARAAFAARAPHERRQR